MKTRKLVVSVFFALALVPMAALASAPHGWWMLSGNSFACKNANTLPPPIFTSPYNMRQWFRLHGSANTQVHHVRGNRGLVVTLSGYFNRHSQHKTTFVYFSEKRGCEYMVHYLKSNGYIPNLSELK